MATAAPARQTQEQKSRGPNRPQRPAAPTGGEISRPAAAALIAPEKIAALENAIATCGKHYEEATTALSKSFAVAGGLKILNDLLDDQMMEQVMFLMNNPLGFLTDRDGTTKNKDGEWIKPYEPNIVKRCVIEGAIRGARWTGNEINIISKRAYLAKNFFQRKVEELPGLRNLEMTPSAPVIGQGGQTALVGFIATWTRHGQEEKLERLLKKIDGEPVDQRISVRVNAGMGPDAVLGKAEKKMLHAIYKLVTNKEVVREGSENEPIDTTATVINDTDEANAAHDAAEAGHEPAPEDDVPAANQPDTAAETQPDTTAPDDQTAGAPTGEGQQTEDVRLSPKCLEFEKRLRNAKNRIENAAIVGDIKAAVDKKELTEADADHLRKLVEENKGRLPAK